MLARTGQHANTELPLRRDEIELLNQYSLHILVQLATNFPQNTLIEPQILLCTLKVVRIFAKCLGKIKVYFFFSTPPTWSVCIFSTFL